MAIIEIFYLFDEILLNLFMTVIRYFNLNKACRFLNQLLCSTIHACSVGGALGQKLIITSSQQTHLNPCFILSSLNDDPRPLERGSWHPLQHGDLFSLMPGRFIYRVEAVGGEESTLRYLSLKRSHGNSIVALNNYLNEVNF